MTSFSFALYSSLFYIESGEIDRMNGNQVMNTHNISYAANDIIYLTSSSFAASLFFQYRNKL